MPELKRARISRIEVLLLVISFLTVGLFFRPAFQTAPGFFVDEASIAFNAHSIAQRSEDEHGVHYPLYFRAFGEYKSPILIYLLAAVYKITGPSVFAARLVCASLGLLAAILLSLLATRITGRRLIGLIVFSIALLTPWLFEVSRLVFEVTTVPALLSGFLLLLHKASQRDRWSWQICAGLGVLLGLLVYSYSAGRLLAPLFAAGLVFFFNRKRWRGIVLTWIVFAVMLIPLAVFVTRNPGALTERFKSVTFVKPTDTRAQVAKRFTLKYAGSFNPRSWLIKGDPEPRHHLPGMGSLLVGMVILATLGLVVILVWHRRETWWRFIIFGLAVSPIPGALTQDHFHTLRLIAMLIFLLVLIAPALGFLISEARDRLKARRVFAVVLVLATFAQAAVFQKEFLTAPERIWAFDSYYPKLLDAALAQSQRPIYLYDKSSAAYMYAYWYATMRDLDLNNFKRANADAPPPAGAVVISHDVPCTNCEFILEEGLFHVYRQR